MNLIEGSLELETILSASETNMEDLKIEHATQMAELKSKLPEVFLEKDRESTTSDSLLQIT